MFKSDLLIKRIIGVKNCWETTDALVYSDNERGLITVKKGFIFDFASVPEWLGILTGFNRTGARYDRASCLHDWLYASKQFDRKTADTIFYEAMLSDKVAKWRAKIMYYAVRLFGGFYWDKEEKL